MNFVESLRMFHVDAKEIPCVTGKGAPAEKTLGAPGVLYMDTDTGDLYKCRAADAVNKVYTWEKIGGGSSDYKLPIGGAQLGGVKNGGNVVINEDGTMTAPEAGSIKITGTENSKIAPTGTILDNGTEIHLVSQEIRVNPGEQYLLTCSANFGNSLYAIYESNGGMKENLTAPATEEGRSEVDLQVSIPSDGAILRVAWNKQVTDTPYAVTKVGNAVAIPKVLDGVTVAVIGDSLVEKNNSAKVNFADILSAETGATITNLGVGGTGYMAGADESKAFYQRAAQIPEGTDRVLIYGSGNDRNMPLGNPTDTGTDTLCGCINATIDAVYERVPTAWVGIIAPAPWRYYPPSDGNNAMALMVQAQQRICARRGIPCLDLYHASGLRPWDDTFRELAFDTEGVHPNDTGHALIAPQIQAFLLGSVGGGAVAPIPDSSQNVELDATLTQSGKAADAKAVGDALTELEQKIPENSGGGVSDYAELTNKPTINGVEVSGNKTSADFGIGNPTNEQVATAVQTYLDEHPEATTTIEDGSITEAKLADGAVSAQKTGFLTFDGNTANMFDKSAVADGKSMAYWSVISDKDGYSLTDFIPVDAQTVYCRSADTFDTANNDTMYTVFYDADKNRFEDTSKMYHRHNSADAPTFTTPEGCTYVRFTLPTTAKDTAMLVKGESVPEKYVPYGSYYTLGDAVRIYARSIQNLADAFKSIPDGTITPKMLSDEVWGQIDSIDEINAKINVGVHQNDSSWVYQTLSGRVNTFKNTRKGILNINTDVSEQTVIVHGVNYFNVDDLVPGNLMLQTGQINTTTYTLSEHLPYFIPIEPGKKLYWNRDYALYGKYCTPCFGFYDADKAFIKEVTGGGTYYGSIEVPENAYFMRICLKNFGSEPMDYKAEKIQISDIDLGNTINGYGSENSNLHYGRVMFFPYIGYRIENGVLVGASDTFVLEDVTHVSVYDTASTIEVTAPIKQAFDRERLNNVVLKYGRHAGSDYVIARVFKTTLTGGTITPKVVAFTPGAKNANALAKENDFVMAVNAGIFDTSDGSCYGTTICNGVVVTDHVDAGTCGMGAGLAIDSSGNLFAHAYDTTTEELLASGVVHAVHAWGALISDYAACDIEQLNDDVTLPGKEPDLFPAKHPRAVVGQYRNGDYLVFTCGGRDTNQAGMTGAEVQEVLIADGVKFAYMLDGGGSCHMLFHKKAIEPYTDGRAVPSYIIFD